MLNVWADMIRTSKDCYHELFINIYLKKFKYLLFPLKTVRNSLGHLMSNYVQSQAILYLYVHLMKGAPKNVNFRGTYLNTQKPKSINTNSRNLFNCNERGVFRILIIIYYPPS